MEIPAERSGQAANTEDAQGALYGNLLLPDMAREEIEAAGAFNQSKWEEELLPARLHLHSASGRQSVQDGRTDGRTD